MSERLRLLLVEDNPGDAALIAELLPRAGPVEYEIEVAPRLATALERLRQERFDVVLLDLGLPDSVGLDTLRVMRREADNIPIVVLTGNDDERTGLAAIQEGAQDYVVKGQAAGVILPRALRYALERHQNAQRLRASEELLRTVIDNLPDAVYVKDTAGRKVLANRADLANIGANDEADVLGKTTLELLPPDVAARVFADDQIVLQRGEALQDREELLVSADGRQRWMLTSKIPLRDAGGRVTGLVGISRNITRRKQAEDALRESATFVQTLIDAIPAPVFYRDVNGRALGWNKAQEAFRGIPRDEILGKTVFETSPDDLAEQYVRSDEMLIEHPGELAYETMVRRADGALRNMVVHKATFTNAAGQVQGIVGVLLDITERVQAEGALRKSEETFRKAFMTSPDAFAITRLRDGMLVSINPSFSRILGYSAEEAVGTTSLELNIWFSPEDREEVVRRLRASGEVAGFEARFVSKNGDIRYGSMSAAIIDLDGAPHILNITRDITERKQAEDELRQGYSRESTINEILRLSLDGLPLDNLIERALHSVLAVPELDIERRGAIFLVTDDPDVLVLKASQGLAEPLLAACARVPFGKCLCGRAAASGQVEFADHIDERHETRYEGIQPHGHYCVPMRLGDRTIGVISLYVQAGRARSVRLEQFLLGVANALAGVIAREQAEAERDRLQGQLLQSQKMEAVGRLAGGVAHDFNNMLTVILGHAEMGLLETDREHPLHADLLEIKKATERSADLTAQLLAFARRQTVAPRVLDLNDTIESMLKMLRRLIGEDINLAWLPEADLWSVKMDPVQVDQILANLCVNARDAIAGVGRVTIETGNIAFDAAYCAEHVGATPGEYVLLAVSDDGSGMDKDMQEHLFEPFFTTKGVGQGTGLGLATVYGIVTQNNGMIHVYSEPGHGSTFRIYIPRHAGASLHESEASAPAMPLGQGEVLLLVDDEPAIAAMGKAMLGRLGYTVLAAETAGEALLLAGQHEGQIDLLITDVVMPEMSGRELCERLQATRPEIRCLYMSGYTANVIAHRGVLDEGVQFIQKPFSSAGLAAKVREALRQA